MQLMLDKLAMTKDSLERIDYHPEQLLGRHIALVALKALLLYNNIELQVAAILHDICKTDTGEFKTDTLGNRYWSNQNHPEQAYNFCKEWDVHKWIQDMGATSSTVELLVLHHMRAKALLEGKRLKYNVRLIPHITEFVTCDDMVWRRKYSIKKRIQLPTEKPETRTITYIGMSEIDKRRGDTFTITIDRVPLTYCFTDIPAFFLNSPLFQYIKPLI